MADDPSIADDTDLWRRVHPYWWVPDQNSGGRRLSTQAFEDSKDGSPMSVVIANETPGIQAVLRGHHGFGLVSLTAGEARACEQRVRRDPMPDEPAHALVAGLKNKRNKKCMLAVARLLVEPAS